MVTIVNYQQRQKEDGETFFVLEVQGGIEMVKSKETGNFYATAKKAFIPSTFTEQVCAALVGTKMEGKIVKQVCEPYTYVVKETGEEIIMEHRWVFTTDEDEQQSPNQRSTIKANADIFSKNGILEPVE